MDEEFKKISENQYNDLIKRMEEVKAIYANCEKICSKQSIRMVQELERAKVDLTKLIVNRLEIDDDEFLFSNVPTLQRMDRRMDKKLDVLENIIYNRLYEDLTN